LETIWETLQANEPATKFSVSEETIALLQKQGLLHGNTKDEVSDIWKEVCNRCPEVNSNNFFGSAKKESLEDSFVFDEKIQFNSNPTNDFCIVFSETGSSVAR
jgi:hypothetical protein